MCCALFEKLIVKNEKSFLKCKSNFKNKYCLVSSQLLCRLFYILKSLHICKKKKNSLSVVRNYTTHENIMLNSTAITIKLGLQCSTVKSETRRIKTGVKQTFTV